MLSQLAMGGPERSRRRGRRRDEALYGIRPVGAARMLGDVGDVARFATKAHFASWTGTAPIDASSGQQQRHRLARAGQLAGLQPGDPAQQAGWADRGAGGAADG